MNLLTNALAFVFVLSIIIFVHEMGHLLVAKAFGIRVPVFSIGFGRALWKFRRGDTEYRVAWIPLGGYVRLGGDDPEELTDDPRDFLNRPRWQRITVYLAGPLANGVLAVVLMAGVFMVGVAVPILPDLPAVVGDVAVDGPAADAGIERGDRIVAVNGRAVDRWDQVNFVLMTSPGRSVALTYERDGQELQTEVVPSSIPGFDVGDAGLYPQVRASVTQILPGQPAAEAGLRLGDELRTMDGRAVVDSIAFVEYIQERPGTPVELEVVRAGRPFRITVVPRDEEGTGRIGVGLGFFQRFGPLAAMREGVRYNVHVVQTTLGAIGRIVTGRMKARSALTGPIGIATMSGAAARSAPRDLVYLMALISVSIGLLNLFPIPVLDGGQILMLLVESALRRDLPMGVKERVQQLGFVLIIALMAMVLYFDVTRSFIGSS